MMQGVNPLFTLGLPEVPMSVSSTFWNSVEVLPEPVEVGRVPSFDGTGLAYQVFGTGPRTVLFGNGVGVGYVGLLRQIEALAGCYRVVTWDYRGLFDSHLPGWGGLEMEAHARDGIALLDHLGVEQASYVGWSMGVQVGFEIARLRPQLMQRIVGIGGVAGNPFKAAFPVPGLERLFPPALQLLSRFAAPLSPLLRRVVDSEAFLRGATLGGYIRPTADRQVFQAMARGVASHDLGIYLETTAALGRHDAEDVLGELSADVLLLVGQKDALTPPREARRLAAVARNGHVHVVDDCSHFVTIEAPEEVNRVVGKFLDSGRL